MIAIDVNIVIGALVEKVWDFLSDLGTLPQRDPGVVKVEWQPPAGVGTVATITAQELGKRTARYEIKEWQPYRRIGVHVASGRGKIDGVYEMEPIEGGRTRLRVTLTVEASGLMRLISPLISYKAHRDALEETERIKRLIEKGGPWS